MTDVPDLLAIQGYAIVPDFLTGTAVKTLVQEARQLHKAGMMRRAGTGKEAIIHSTLRADFIHWLEPPECSAAQQHYLGRLETLRLQINQALQLGLFDFEGHLAIYPPGAFYRKHVDRFLQDNRRTLSCILYLNPDWCREDGGELRLYLDGGESGEYLDIPPVGGTLVTFLSARFWHEVLPANKDRISLTGWFRTRNGATP